MNDSNTMPQNPIPNAEMPPSALQAAKDSIFLLGFPREAMLENYKYSFRDHTIHINSMIFAHALHRNPAEYASFTIFNPANGQSDPEIVSYLSYTSAPFHLIHRNEQFSLWSTRFDGGSPQPQQIVDSISYDRLAGALSDFREDFNPKRIIDVKQGRDQFVNPIFRDLNILQLSLWTLDVTADLLEDYFRLAINQLRNYQINEEELSDLAIQLLGITILRDTRTLGSSEYLLRDFISLDQLMEVANQRFPSYFSVDLFEKYSQATQDAYKILSQISYAAFAPDMLSRLYTAAYTQAERKKLGRYDTPLYLTRHIWNNIPVEYLRPELRITADMTCGWGSFLIAGHDRLSNLSDMDPTRLATILFGNDIDVFTAKLARLALLLYSGSDSWNIGHTDAQTWQWLSSNSPNIIVGNPPFGGDRKTGLHLTSEKPRREQTADRYLSLAIEKLSAGGYLAMLMPQSFLTAEASPDLRQKLLRMCDLLEIWELPTDIFSNATAETLVIFGQKNKREESKVFPTRLRSLQRKTLPLFKERAIFSSSALSNDQHVWKTLANKAGNQNHEISYLALLGSDTWAQIQRYTVPLKSVAHIFPGMIPGRGNNNPVNDPKEIFWLTPARKVITNRFVIDYSIARQGKYPNDFERPRETNERFLKGEKVLLSYLTNPSWGKRNRVAIERRGYYVSHGFWVIVAQFQSSRIIINNEFVAAVLDWIVSNGWIVEHQKTTNIRRDTIDSVPFPNPSRITQNDIDLVTEAVRILEDKRTSAQAKNEADRLIDSVLKHLYSLNMDLYEQLKRIRDWNDIPNVTIDQIHGIEPNQNWIVSGITEEVIGETGQIRVWIEGFDDIQIVSIDPAMPGWMLRPNAAFRTYIPRYCLKSGNLENVKWGAFLPQTYTYLDEDELFDELEKLQHKQ